MTSSSVEACTMKWCDASIIPMLLQTSNRFVPHPCEMRYEVYLPKVFASSWAGRVRPDVVTRDLFTNWLIEQSVSNHEAL